MMKSKFRLLLVANGKVLRLFILTDGVNQVGRSPYLAICLPYDSVSRSHVKLIVSGDRVTARDVGSRNGTMIDGHKIQNCLVRPGQWIQCGEVRLLLITDDEEQNFDFGSDIETVDPKFSKDRLLELPSDLKSQFTPRQQEVLQLAWNARAKKQIAAELGISIETVKRHLQAIYSICQVQSVGEFHQYLCRRVIQALMANYTDVLSCPPTNDQFPPDVRQERRA